MEGRYIMFVTNKRFAKALLDQAAQNHGMREALRDYEYRIKSQTRRIEVLEERYERLLDYLDLEEVDTPPSKRVLVEKGLESQV